MRFLYLILISLLVASCFSSEKEKNEDKWKLYWSEEFNYKGLPDSTKWNYDVGGDGWGNRELQYYTKASINNAEVSDGSLKINVRKEKMDNCEYTSARLVTRGKADFKYGKIEIRAKLPAGRGLWPAIWMLGSRVGEIPWPDCGEIDIMEHVGFQKDSVLSTIHTKAYNHIQGTQKGKKIFIDDPYHAWHIYSLEWTPEEMSFLVDDKSFYNVPNEHRTTAEWPFDSTFYLIMNIAVGGNLGGKEGVDEAIFPATMQVDYVRVYKSVNE